MELTSPAHLCKQVSDDYTPKAACPESFTPTHTHRAFTPQSTVLSRQDVANIVGAYLAIIPQTFWPKEISPGPGKVLLTGPGQWFFVVVVVVQDYIFRAVLGSKLHRWGKDRVSPNSPCSHTCIVFRPPLSPSPTRMVPMSPRMNLHPHVIITQSPEYTPGFTLAGVYSTGLDEYTMTCFQHNNVIQHCDRSYYTYHIRYTISLI